MAPMLFDDAQQPIRSREGVYMHISSEQRTAAVDSITAAIRTARQATWQQCPAVDPAASMHCSEGMVP